jgi:valyl-tRNA synthetase
MTLTKQYHPKEAEAHLKDFWQAQGVAQFDPELPGKVFSIDTPPPTVSGRLHMGHVYSYSHTDFIARYQRMRGCNVFYPMGFDDNGLPTERLVEKRLQIRPAQLGRAAFIEKCLQISEEAEQDYRELWQRLGLSIDWRYTYRTIESNSQRTSQLSFLDLARKGLVYRREAPSIWCPECQTAIAQAELEDMEQQSEYLHLAFSCQDGSQVVIATTRPELLPACVAVFVHPDDQRYRRLVGQTLTTPLFGKLVPVLADPAADPEKGTGAVMCCTFGDTTDVNWWQRHHLPLVQVLDRAGRLTDAGGAFAGLTIRQARDRIREALQAQGLLLERQPTCQSIRVHERCDTPVEYLIAMQWFVRLLDAKARLLEAGRQVRWHPEHMQARYESWVKNLNWDWCISRQRTFGVPFPAWHCRACGETLFASADQLPLNPEQTPPPGPCACGSQEFSPDPDVMDTWATSSLSPQITGQWLENPALYERVFPFSLRPQAHEIIRTWAFYTLVKSQFNFDALPWKDVLISGWGLAPEGKAKISKSRGEGAFDPLEMIERYSADALRYWAASTAPGKDTIISEEKIQMGARLATKLWNVARFSERFLIDFEPDRFQPGESQKNSLPADSTRFGNFLAAPTYHPDFSLADRWILARCQQVVRQATEALEDFDYATAKNEIDAFFWHDLSDNYLEMCKQRLYDEAHPQREGARFALQHVLLSVLKLFAPLLPFVTEQIYQGLFAGRIAPAGSIHKSAWPTPEPLLEDPAALEMGETLIEIASAVRRYKSEHNLPLGTELARLQLVFESPEQALGLQDAAADLVSICRVAELEAASQVDPGLIPLGRAGTIQLAIQI